MDFGNHIGNLIRFITINIVNCEAIFIILNHIGYDKILGSLGSNSQTKLLPTWLISGGFHYAIFRIFLIREN